MSFVGGGGMRARQTVLALGICGALGAAAVLSAEGDKPRASVPPGVSQDGSRPSEGAIKGGSIDARKKNGASADAPRGEVERCRDLEGTLRRQCIEDARKRNDTGRPTGP